MPYYVDIAAVGIQRYLARTATLRARRNASAALVDATAPATLAPVLRGRAEVNADAGDIDGVVSLVLHDSAQRDPVVEDVLAQLRRRLPGAEFQVADAEAGTYLQARVEGLNPKIERGDVQLDLPPAAEFPAALRCGFCHVDPAVGEVHLGEEDGVVRACADCAMRHSTTSNRQGRTAEEELLHRVGATQQVHGFDELAKLAHDRDDRTQLATVYADGNQVGEFLTQLADQYGDDRTVASTAVQSVDLATREALVAATCKVRGGDPRAPLCVVPHVVGGDDVLVSMPADRAWAFTREFIQQFSSQITWIMEHAGIEDVHLPTMSAGIVFAHRNHAFAQAAEQAYGCLRQAKREGAGREGFIGFHDVTHDDTQPSRPVSIADLRRHGRDLSELRRLSRTHRRQLDDTLRHAGPIATHTLAARLGTSKEIAPFLPEPSHEHEPNENTGSSGPGITLETAMQIARWW